MYKFKWALNTPGPISKIGTIKSNSDKTNRLEDVNSRPLQKRFLGKILTFESPHTLISTKTC